MRASRLSVALAVASWAAVSILTPSSAAPASDPYEVLHSFTNPPSTTIAGFVEIGDKLYGVSREGGASDLGTVFEVDPAAGRHRVLYSFSGRDDGGLPSGRLAWVPNDPAGPALYGTTLYYGTGGAGTVFRLTLDGTLSTLHAFAPNAITGSYPQGGLVLRPADGWLYGTTGNGGANGNGTLYRVAPGRSLEVVHSFDSGADGAYPYGELAIDVAGTLYGVAPNQGYGRYGTIYRVRFDGAAPAFETLYTLTVDRADALGFYAQSVSVAGDELLVTTSDSNRYRGGTVFAFNTVTHVARLLHEFNPDAEGKPTAAPVADVDGSFVGATSNNRTFGVNVVYRIGLNGAFSIVAPLDFYDEGFSPAGPLLRAADARFYGATAQGGGAHVGAVFAVDAAGARAVVEFGEGAVSWSPAGLARTESGGLVGVTWWGGSSGLGTVFGLEGEDPVATLASFEGRNNRPPEAYELQASRPLLAGDGFLYMVTWRGGENHEGALVRYEPGSDVVERVHSFGLTSTDARRPVGLGLGPDGRVYGATWRGGLVDGGTVFVFDPASATVRHLADLPAQTWPAGGVAVGPDGSVYGVSEKGVYAVDPEGGNARILVSSAGSWTGIVLVDGWLYATSHSAGRYGKGTLFRVRTDGSGYTVLHEFTGGTDGCRPLGNLSFGPGGTVLGTTAGSSWASCTGDRANRGSLFQWGADGFTLLRSFSLSTGGDPLSAPIVGVDGNLYGATSLGGRDGGGVLYRIRLAPEVSVSGPHSIQEGASVTLTTAGSDPQGLPVSYAWDLDGDGQFDDATGASAAFSANHRDRDGDGTYPVSVRATDVTGLFAVANTTVTVSNVAPTVSLAPAAARLPRDAVGTLTATFADPGPDTWTVRIEYGDGAFEERSPTNPGAVAFAHSWSNPGRYTVRVTVTDDDGGVGSAAVTVEVGGPEDSIRQLIEEVEGLLGGGELRRGQAYSLIGKLQLALWFLRFANGEGMAAVALDLFVLEVDFYIRTGVLSPEEGSPLLATARGVIAQLRAP